MKHDSLDITTPLGKAELVRLRAMQLGDSWDTVFVPGLPAAMEWRCTGCSEINWKFEGWYCGVLFKKLMVTLIGNSLVMVEES